jgi:hypothetical protein
MGAWLKLLLGLLTIFTLAYWARRSFVPDVVPIGFADAPQPIWMVETAFLLRAVENVAAACAAIVVATALAHWLRYRIAPADEQQQ